MGTLLGSRRAAALIVALTVAASILIGGPAPAEAGDGPLRVYVITIDGLRPSEVGPLTPNISSLRQSGTWYEQARAVFPAETLPNHVAMMTGVLPEDSGIIGNQFWVPNLILGERRNRHYMDEPQFLEADTLVTRLERACDDDGGISTATVQSKTYLHGIFRGEPENANDPFSQREADFHWQSPAYIPQSDHILDPATMDAFRSWVAAQPADLPQFGFVNLGDVDRSGHIDEGAVTTVGGLTTIRQAAIESADAQIGLLIEDLKAEGAWDDTVLIVNSDHGMDWGPQNNRIDPDDILREYGYKNRDSAKGADYVGMSSGGAGFIYVHHKSEIDRMAQAMSEAEGVDFVAMRDPLPGPNFVSLASMGVDHPNSPDIMFFAEPSYHIDLINTHQNPLPGNHAHPATQQSTLFVSGGHPALSDEGASVAGETVYPYADGLFAPPAGGPGNLSVAPTVSSLFGIGAPDGGYAVEPLSEPFDAGTFDGSTVCDPAPGDTTRTSSPTRTPVEGPPLTTVSSTVIDADLSRVTYRLTATNRGGSTADPVTMSAAVPALVTFRSSSPAATAATCVDGAPEGAVCEWSLGAIAPGESKSVEVTYAWDGATAQQNQIRLTTTVRAPGQPAVGDQDFGTTLARASLHESTTVDRSQPRDTNYGGCDTLRVSADDTVTTFLDYDVALRDDWTWSHTPARPSFRVLGAQVRVHVLSTQYTEANPGTFGLFPVIDGDWDPGVGGCAGGEPINPVNENVGGSRERVARSGWTPTTTEQPLATTTVVDAGAAVWDIAEFVDTPEERNVFNGFELRDLTPGATEGETTFSNVAAFNSPIRITLPQVIVDAPGSFAQCVDADPEPITSGGNREVRIDVYATSGPKVTNGDADACTGDPYQGELFWKIEDDDPDSYFVTANGSPVHRQLETDGGVGPETIVTRPDEEGHASITVRATRSTDGGSVRIGVRGSGDAAEDGENVFCGNLSTCTGEAAFEDDVTITWTPQAATLATSIAFAPGQSSQGQFSDETPFSVSLTDETGAPIPGAAVQLEIAGDGSSKSYEGTTDDGGAASIPVRLAQRPGVYDVTASFAGSDAFDPSTAVMAFLITKEDSDVTVTVAGNGNRRTLTAVLVDRDTDSDGIGDATIDFYANGTLIGSAVTDAGGVATLVVPARYRGPGTIFEARFGGNDYYLTSSDVT